MKTAIIYDMLYPFNIGGVELRNYETAKQLIKKGHEVHLYGAKLWKGKNVLKKEGIFYHGVCRYKELHNFRGKRRIIEPLKLSLYLFPELLKEKYDIIECASFPYFPFISCFLVSKLKKIPLVTVWHQYFGDYWFNYFGWFKGSFAYLFERLVKKLSKINIAVSEKTRQDLGKGIVVENGIDLDWIKKARVAKEKSDLVYVGRLIDGKNVELLLESLKMIKEKYPEIKLLIVGEGPRKEALKSLVKRLGIDNNVKFLGHRKRLEVYSLIKASKVFGFPSLVEGFGMVVMEAFACGKPVIAVKHRWNASYTLINSKGFVAENNGENFSEKVINLLSNKKLRENMGERAKKEAEKYRWSVQTDKLLKVYENEII